MPTRKPPKSAKTKKPLTAHCGLALLIDDDATPVFDEYVTEAQAQRFMRLIDTIGPLPKPPRQKPEPPLPPRDHVRVFVDDIWGVLENPACPVPLYNLIADYLNDLGQAVRITDHTGQTTQAADPLHIRLLSKWLPLALEASTNGATPQPLNFQRAGERLAMLMEDESTPPGLRSALNDAVLQFVEDHDGVNTGAEVARFQLAGALMKAARQEPGPTS